MGKYSDYDPIDDYREDSKTWSLRYIANELAEANRLKRLELECEHAVETKDLA